MNKKTGFLMIIIFLLVVIVVLIGNYFESKGEIMKKSEDKYVTKEYIMERYQITEEDIKGLDVEEILKRYPSTVDAFKDIKSKDKVINNFMRFQKLINEREEDEKYLDEVSLTHLVHAEKKVEKFPDMNTVKYIAYSNDNYELYTLSFLIDFEKNKYYGATGTLAYLDYADAPTVINITDAGKRKIINALKEAKLEEWKQKCEVKEIESGWDMGIEFQDGTVVSFNSGGKIPDEYFDAIIGAIPQAVSYSNRDFSTLKSIEYKEKTGRRSMEVNFREMTFQYRNYDKEKDISGELTKEQEEDIIQLFEDKEVNEWKEISVLDYYDWYITLEYIDGAEITHGKLQDVKAPKESEEVINSLIDILGVEDD